MNKLRNTAIAIAIQSLVFLTINQNAIADVIIDYSVDIVESGPVMAGTVINWNIFVTVTTSDATNFGIATAAIDLQDSFLETLDPGTVDGAFPAAGYFLTSGGAYNAGTNKLENIGASSVNQSVNSFGQDGNSLGPFVLATGSYAVNQVGLHSLSTVSSASLSRYYTAAGQALGDSSVYDNVTFGSDSILVTAVPEPGSGIILFALGLFGLAKRRRRQLT